MPSLLCPWLDPNAKTSQEVPRFLSFVTLQKERSGSFSIQDEGKDTMETKNVGLREDVSQISGICLKQSGIDLSCDQSFSFKRSLTGGNTELSSIWLSSHQVSLLLSSIWVQATSAENTSTNFMGMAQTCSIVLPFARSKTSSHAALVRCFQLAFSLRSISLDQEGGLHPSRRRLLFTLASSMLIFSARAASFLELIPIVKESLTDETVDPYLELFNDIRLQSVSIESDKEKISYGSQEDEVSALKSLSFIELDDQKLKETVMSHFMSKSAKLTEDELSSIKNQLSDGFSPDDAYPIGPPLFMETPQPSSPHAQLEFPYFDEVAGALTDEEAFPEPSGSQSGCRTSLSINTISIIGVTQLLESISFGDSSTSC